MTSNEYMARLRAAGFTVQRELTATDPPTLMLLGRKGEVAYTPDPRLLTMEERDAAMRRFFDVYVIA